MMIDDWLPCGQRWNPSDLEAKSKKRTFAYPVKQLRERLAIKFYKNGCFFNDDRRLVAMRAEMESFRSGGEIEEADICIPSEAITRAARDQVLQERLLF